MFFLSFSSLLRDDIRTAIGLHRGGDAGPTPIGESSSNRNLATQHLWRGTRWSLLYMMSTKGTFCVFFGFDACHQKEMLPEWLWSGSVCVELLVDKKSAEALGKLRDDDDIAQAHDGLYQVNSMALDPTFRSWQSTREPRADFGAWTGLLNHQQLISLAKAQAESDVAEAVNEMDTDTLFSPALDQDFLGSVTFTLKITATQFFQIERADLAENYDSKLHTGMVGLLNQGATCYLNGILQMLFHVEEFRQAIFHLPVDEDASTQQSSTLALQAVFKKLQLSSRSVTTDDLTAAFGWTSADAFLQQDAQEMMGKLLERLQDSTLGSQVEGFVENLFSGRLCSYIKCLNVPVESNREEEFSHIQLDVIGCANIYDSLRKFVATDKLEGENKYDSGSTFGKQDAEKGVIFLELPPVLTIVLKRIEFDVQQMCFAKVHDNHTFPEHLCLDEFVRKDYQQASKGDNDYVLHSVLVHSGDVGAGHYYTYIRPSCGMDYSKLDKSQDGEWYRFNDERVCKVSSKEAVDYNFGAGNLNRSNAASAYMLLYVRAQDAGKVMRPGPVGDAAVPAKLMQKLVAEERLRLRQEGVKKRTGIYMTVSYVTEQNLADFDGYNMFSDFVSEEAATKLRIFKHSTTLGVIVSIIKQCSLALSTFRLWKCHYSQLEGGIGIFIDYPVDIMHMESESSSEDSDEVVDELDELVGNGTMYYIDTRGCLDMDNDDDFAEFNSCQKRQELLLAEDASLMEELRNFFAESETGLFFGTDFDTIANNNAVSSHLQVKHILKNIDDSNHHSSKLTFSSLSDRVKVLVSKWREHVRRFYPAFFQSRDHPAASSNATDDLLCFVKVFDPLHALPGSIAKAPGTKMPGYFCELSTNSESELEKSDSSSDDENGRTGISKNKKNTVSPQLGKRRVPQPEGGTYDIPLKFLQAMYFNRQDSVQKVINEALLAPLQNLLAMDSSSSGDLLREILHGKFHVSLQKSGQTVSLERVFKALQTETWAAELMKDPNFVRPRYDESNMLSVTANWPLHSILQLCKSRFPLFRVEEAVIIVIEPRGVYGHSWQEMIKRRKPSYFSERELYKSMNCYYDWWNLVINRIPCKLIPFDKETASSLHALQMLWEGASHSQAGGSADTKVGAKRKGEREGTVNTDCTVDEFSLKLPGALDGIVSLDARPDFLRYCVAGHLGFTNSGSAEQLNLYYQVMRRVVIYVAWSASASPISIEPFGYHDAGIGQQSLRESQYDQVNELGHPCYIYYRLAPIARFAREKSAERDYPISYFGLRSLEVRIVDARLLHWRKMFLKETSNQSHEAKEDNIDYNRANNAIAKHPKIAEKMPASQSGTRWPCTRQSSNVEGLSEIDFRDMYPELSDRVFMVSSNGIAVGEFVKMLRTELGLPLDLNETHDVSPALKDALIGAGDPSLQFPLVSDFCESNTLPKFPIALLNVNNLDISVMSAGMTLGTVAVVKDHVDAISKASLSPLTSDDVTEFEVDEPHPNPLPHCWFNALDWCTVGDCNHSYVAVQHISNEDLVYMRNQAGLAYSDGFNVPASCVVSVPIIVYSFILHGSACAPIFSDEFPMPFLSYIRKDDSVDSLAGRFAEITGESNSVARVAVIKDRLPTFLRRPTDSAHAADEKIQTVWQILAANYSVPSRVGDPVPSPIPHIGIQRSASQLQQSGSRTPGSIKIS